MPMNEGCEPTFDDSDFDPHDAAPLIWQVMGDDWDKPEMDAYDSYAEQTAPHVE